jgi:hypothetical protein
MREEERWDQGMETGVPDWLIITVFGARVRTRVISASMFGGRERLGRSNPSDSQSLCIQHLISFLAFYHQ